MHHVWEIPELFAMILNCGSLETNDMFHLLLVSHLFYDRTVPVLWAEVNLEERTDQDDVSYGFEILLPDVNHTLAVREWKTVEDAYVSVRLARRLNLACSTYY